MRRFLAGAITLAALLIALPARADEKDVEAYLQAFYESALWQDGRWPLPVEKWTQPIRIRMTGPMSGTYSDIALRQLREMAALAGVSVTILEPAAADANFLIEFVDASQLFANGRAAACVSSLTPGAGGAIDRVRLQINLYYSADLRQCIAHELMHAMGFPGHPHAIDSVLSYTHNREGLTGLDRMSLRILYDARIKPGILQLPAMAAARDVLVDKMVADGAAPETRDMGRRFIKNLAPLTIKLAEDGNVGLQMELGYAYSFGQVVDRNEKAGFLWFKRAAVATQPEWQRWRLTAVMMVGYDLWTGHGVEADPAEGVLWYRRAADLGQIAAMNNLGVAFNDGKGVAKDPVEAYKWFSLAADRGLPVAKKNLAELISKLTAEEVEQGRQRAAAWTPSRN